MGAGMGHLSLALAAVMALWSAVGSTVESSIVGGRVSLLVSGKCFTAALGVSTG